MSISDWYIVFKHGVDLDAIAAEIRNRILPPTDVLTCSSPPCRDKRVQGAGNCQARVVVTASGPMIVITFASSDDRDAARAASIGWLMARADYVADFCIDVSVGTA